MDNSVQDVLVGTGRGGKKYSPFSMDTDSRPAQTLLEAYTHWHPSLVVDTQTLTVFYC